MQIKLLNILKEITIKNNNITVKELNDYVENNIIHNYAYNILPVIGWKEYIDLINKYLAKYRVQDVFKPDFPQQARNLFYRELQQLVKKYVSNNI